MAFEIGWHESARKELASREVVANSCAFSKMVKKISIGDAHVFISGKGLFLQYADTNTIFCEKNRLYSRKPESICLTKN